MHVWPPALSSLLSSQDLKGAGSLHFLFLPRLLVYDTVSISPPSLDLDKLKGKMKEFRESFVKTGLKTYKNLIFKHEPLNIVVLLAPISTLPKPNPGLWMLKAIQENLSILK